MNRIGTVLLLMVLLVAPAGAAQVGRECYGDAIDVDLGNGPDGPVARVRVPLSLSSISISIRDGSSSPPDPLHKCMPEPIHAENIFLIFNHRAVPELNLPAELSVTSMQVWYGGFGWNTHLTPSMDAHISKYLDAGVSVVMPNGFTKLYPAPENRGEYISPPDFLEAGGRRVDINCGGMVFVTQCDTAHNVRDGLWVSYRFDYAKVDPMRWRELDTAVTAAAAQLFR